MAVNKETIYTVDLDNKKIKVEREFDAPLAEVWKAWTDSEILDQWWAPKPWKAITTSLDFRVGGFWLYSMAGPDGTKHFSRADFTAITPKTSFTSGVGFCDESGNRPPENQTSTWVNNFKNVGETTKVEIEITFPTLELLNQNISMGFKEGFAMGHRNLDEVLAK